MQVKKGDLLVKIKPDSYKALARAAGGGDQLGESDESSTKGDDDEDGAGPQTRR